MKEKFLKVIRNILISVVCFVVVLITGVFIYFRTPVLNYYKNSSKAFVIPGINKGFIAQGISFDTDSNYFFITGYMKDGSASPIYVVDKQSKKLVNSVLMANSDNSDFTGHAGGLSVYKNTVYVAGGEDCCLYGFDKNEIITSPKNSRVRSDRRINLKTENDGVGVAFTTVHQDMIFAGEFYRLPNYPTLDSHIVSCADGENHALMIGLKQKENGFVPEVVYSIPGKVQGICFADGKIYVSTSYGPAFSYIYVYDESKLKQTSTINTLENELPLYILDSSSLCDTKKIAPMSEEIEFVDNKFYIMCESASNKYIFGKFTGARWCYKTEF